MSEEEKNIVSQIKDMAQYSTIIHYDGHDTMKITPRLEQTMVLNNYTAKVLYDLIEKQRKEIEDLKDVQQQICNEELLTQEYVQNNYIRKDKIKEKIKDIIKYLEHEPYIAFDAYGELLYDTEIDIKQKLNKLLEE